MRVRFKNHFKAEMAFNQLNLVFFINIIFILFAFLIFSSRLIVVSGINIKLPSTITPNELDNSLIVVINDAGKINIEGKEISALDFEKIVKKGKFNSVFIKAAANSSLETVTNIWGICKKFHIKRIGLATTVNKK
jgi:biopolymer transport protein ExbD